MRQSNKKSSDGQYHQTMFKSYLQAFREEKGWSRQDLAKELGVALTTVDKFEGKVPGKVAEVMRFLKTFAALKGISVHSFVSILLGELNEEASPGTAFSNELANEIKQLDLVSQSKIKYVLGLEVNKNDKKQFFEILFQSSKASKDKLNLYETIPLLREKQTISLNLLIKSFME